MSSVFDITDIDYQIKDQSEHGWIQPLMNRFPECHLGCYDAPVKEFAKEIRLRYSEYTGPRTIKALKQTTRRFFITDHTSRVYLIDLPVSMRGCVNMIYWTSISYDKLGRKVNYGLNSMTNIKELMDNRWDWFEINGKEYALFWNALNSGNYRFVRR